MQRSWAWWASLALLSVALTGLRSDASLTHVVPLNPRMNHLPRLTVWAWERREDLHTLDPETTAIAYLDRTVTLDARGLTIEPRHQSLLLPASAALTRIPVVRIETGKGPNLTDASAAAAAIAILGAIDQHSAALQIDFDARLSEREWYKNVLTRVRAKLPASMSLSITALASWCSYDNAWLKTLPVDEAVPMRSFGLARIDRPQILPPLLHNATIENDVIG
jgi:hypothetical protein